MVKVFYISILVVLLGAVTKEIFYYSLVVFWIDQLIQFLDFYPSFVLD
jgi:hypothetical protein